MERITTVTCPYCNKELDTGSRYPEQQARYLSEHKARCPQKRYLGGDLELD